MELHLLAHNIRSAENIGSILRTADSLGVAKVWIVGYSPTPEHQKVAKTALGAQESVPWEQEIDIVVLIKRLRDSGFRIIGLELDERSQDIATYKASEKIALLLGNEVEGIPPSLRDICDDLVQIRQKGKKESLNVSVATGIAAFHLIQSAI
ncbi:TrmH family RNA methyltransferase [Candidatus Uhrbacteria bacterium]|nr:TrmH family RNA methyltransferase [Candidatus Uhrbacteria bacterium]